MISLDNPLGADADILAKEALQRPLVQAEPADDIVNPGDFAVSHYAVDDPAGLGYILISRWQRLTKEGFRELDHLLVFFLRHNRFFEGLGVHVKNFRNTDYSVG